MSKRGANKHREAANANKYRAARHFARRLYNNATLLTARHARRRKTLIIDNSPSSYIFNPESAIGCASFIDDPTDFELKQICSFLLKLKDVDDVRCRVSEWKSFREGMEIGQANNVL